MWSRKKKTFREDLYLPKRQLKKPKRVENVEGGKKTFPWITLSLWVIFLSTVLYMLFFSPVMKIDTLHVEGEKLVSKTRIEELFVAEGDRYILSAVKRNNFFLFRKQLLQEQIGQEFPAAERVVVTKSFPNKINVFITERDFALLWCSRGPCYLLDRGNIALAGDQVPERRGELPLYTIVDTSGLPVEIGRTLFDYPFLENFRENKERLRTEFGLMIKPEMLSASRFSDELRFQLESGWEVYINNRVSPEKTIKTLHTFFDQELPLERQSELRYVDLRTENRVYYALKGEQKEEKEEEEEGSEQNKNTKETKKKEKKKD